MWRTQVIHRDEEAVASDFRSATATATAILGEPTGGATDMGLGTAVILPVTIGGPCTTLTRRLQCRFMEWDMAAVVTAAIIIITGTAGDRVDVMVALETRLAQKKAEQSLNHSI